MPTAEDALAAQYRWAVADGNQAELQKLGVAMQMVAEQRVASNQSLQTLMNWESFQADQARYRRQIEEDEKFRVGAVELLSTLAPKVGIEFDAESAMADSGHLAQMMVNPIVQAYLNRGTMQMDFGMRQQLMKQEMDYDFWKAKQGLDMYDQGVLDVLKANKGKVDQADISTYFEKRGGQMTSEQAALMFSLLNLVRDANELPALLPPDDYIPAPSWYDIGDENGKIIPSRVSGARASIEQKYNRLVGLYKSAPNEVEAERVRLQMEALQRRRDAIDAAVGDEIVQRGMFKTANPFRMIVNRPTLNTTERRRGQLDKDAEDFARAHQQWKDSGFKGKLGDYIAQDKAEARARKAAGLGGVPEPVGGLTAPAEEWTSEPKFYRQWMSARKQPGGTEKLLSTLQRAHGADTSSLKAQVQLILRDTKYNKTAEDKQLLINMLTALTQQEATE